MKKLILFALMAVSLCHSQSSGGNRSSGGGITITTVAGLASVSGKVNGTLATITNGNTATDCTVGGGTSLVNCQFNGTSWAQAVAASSGATAFSALTGATNNSAAMHVGTGASLDATGSGTIVATSAAGLNISGQSAFLFFAGLTSTNRIKTVRDAADTILELGGSYTPTGTWTNFVLVNPALGTPASGVFTNLTGNCTACNAAGFTGNLAGDATGAQGSTVVSKINGGSVPATAAFLGSDGSSKPIASTPHAFAVLLGCNDSSGSGTAQLCTSSPTFVPAAGDTIIYKTTTTNTGDVTINVNSSSAAHARKWQASSTLVAGDLVASVYNLATFDGTFWNFYTIGNAPAGSGTINAAQQFAIAQYSAAGSAATVSGIAGPTAVNSVPQFWITTPSAGAATATTSAPAGVVTNAQTGTTYTIAATDRAEYLSFSNGSAIAITLPQAGTTGFASNFVFVGCDIGAGTATITPTTSTISYTTGSSYSAAQATLALTTGQCAWVYSDNTNYFAIVRGGAAGAPSYPVTVAGTTISGGIPCFTSTTVESSSAILNANILTKGGGAGVCPTNSSITDNGTTISSAEPIALGTATCTTFGTAGGICPAEGTAPTNVSGAAPLYPDSTAHEYMAKLNGSASPGMMVRSQPGAIHVTAQTATKTIYTLCAAAAGACNVAGQYRINWYFNQGGTACGTPTPGQVTFALSWTDNAGAHSAVVMPMNDDSSIAVFTSAFKFASSNTSGFASGEVNIWSTGGADIQVTNTYTACGVGTGTWELSATAERVQ